jgi:hypothetical protein
MNGLRRAAMVAVASLLLGAWVRAFADSTPPNVV